MLMKLADDLFINFDEVVSIEVCSPEEQAMNFDQMEALIRFKDSSQDTLVGQTKINALLKGYEKYYKIMMNSSLGCG